MEFIALDGSKYRKNWCWNF